MEFETRSQVTEADYLEMIRLKTAVLLGFSLKLGGILAGASAEDKQALYEFGVLMGIGFQLKDDLLDVYADQKTFGKQVGGDIIANKKTFLLIHALRKARGKNKTSLAYWLARKKFSPSKKVKAVTAIYDALEIPLQTETKIATYFSQAFQAFQKVNIDDSRKESLKTFALDLIKRQV